MYTIKLSNPSYPKGEELHLTGVGLVKNGSSAKLDKEAEENLVTTVGMSVDDYFKNNGNVEVSGTSELNDKGGEE